MYATNSAGWTAKMRKMPELKPRPNGHAVRILDMIEERGGMTAGQIQRELWRMSYPDQPFTHKNRGWWCTKLYGSFHSGTGLLKFYCEKQGKRWVRKADVPHNGHPFQTMSGASKWKINVNYASPQVYTALVGQFGPPNASWTP